MGAFNVLSQSKVKSLLITTDKIELGYGLLTTNNSYSTENKKFRENKIPIQKQRNKNCNLFRVTSSELRSLCNTYGLLIWAPI